MSSVKCRDSRSPGSRLMSIPRPFPTFRDQCLLTSILLLPFLSIFPLHPMSFPWRLVSVLSVVMQPCHRFRTMRAMFSPIDRWIPGTFKVPSVTPCIPANSTMPVDVLPQEHVSLRPMVTVSPDGFPFSTRWVFALLAVRFVGKASAAPQEPKGSKD